jgi:hypothetical protein
MNWLKRLLQRWFPRRLGPRLGDEPIVPGREFMPSYFSGELDL